MGTLSVRLIVRLGARLSGQDRSGGRTEMKYTAKQAEANPV